MKSWIMRVLVLAMLVVCVAAVGRAQESHPSSNPNVAPSESKLAAHPAESRTERNLILPELRAFASLGGKPFPTYSIPLQAGMSIGMLLICTELIMMLIILLFVPRDYAGPCFIGFAIGESLGAAALRIAGGIFTKIADIGSDLMKIVFNIKEDDARNPGVIADCTGDNAGDSVGPTADGFETYG